MNCNSCECSIMYLPLKCRFSNNFNVSIVINPHSCNSTSEDLQVCSTMHDAYTTCPLINIIQCAGKYYTDTCILLVYFIMLIF